MPSTQPARGMRDFLPADLRRRAFVIDVIERVYQRYGFEPLETPAVENIETLLGKYGEEGNQLIFKILKRGEHAASGQADLALRYDLTVPLARVVAEHRATLPKFFKRYQIQPVWRADRPARGRFREFYQCDVDAIGSTSLLVEAELCAAASEALTTLGFADFTIRLNHRALLDGMLSAAGLEAARHGDALVALDKLDKIGREGVLKEFDARGLSADAGVRLLDLLDALAAEPDGAIAQRRPHRAPGSVRRRPRGRPPRPRRTARPAESRPRNAGGRAPARRRQPRPRAVVLYRARSSKSPCPISPAASVVADATMASWGCSSRRTPRSPPADSRSASNASSS